MCKLIIDILLHAIFILQEAMHLLFSCLNKDFLGINISFTNIFLFLRCLSNAVFIFLCHFDSASY